MNANEESNGYKKKKKKKKRKIIWNLDKLRNLISFTWLCFLPSGHNTFPGIEVGRAYLPRRSNLCGFERAAFEIIIIVIIISTYLKLVN